MSVNIITLEREAVISDPHLKIDHLMLCFFFSKYNQTTLAIGNVVSLTKMLQKYTDEPLQLKDALNLTLTNYLSEFFTSVNANVQVAPITENGVETGGWGISLDITVSDADSTTSAPISVGYSLTYESTILREILETHSGRNLLEYR